MPIYQDPNSPITCVMIKGAFIVWDGVSRPEANDGGNMRWNIKVVVPPNHPDIAILNDLANQELQASEFKGILPNGGIMPVGTAGPAEFSGLYPGWAVVNCSTFKVPQVYDEAGQLLDPMVYGAQLYTGQQVDVLVHCKAYNNKSKGVAARMDGFSIITSANAARTEIGGGGINSAGAFGGGGGQQQGGYQQQPQQQQPQQQQPQQQQPQQQQPQQQQPQQGGYPQPQQQQPQQQQPQQQQPQQGGYQQPQQQQQPQQSTNFLPNGGQFDDDIPF